MKNTSQYVEFFKRIAENHEQIKHSDSEPHFTTMLKGAAMFSNTLENLLSEIKSSLIAPFFILEIPNTNYGDNSNDWAQLNKQGVFYLLQKVESQELNLEVITEMESILYDILGYMKEYNEVNPNQFTFNYQSISSLPVNFVVGDTFQGIKVTISMKIPGGETIFYNPNKWLNPNILF